MEVFSSLTSQTHQFLEWNVKLSCIHLRYGVCVDYTVKLLLSDSEFLFCGGVEPERKYRAKGDSES